MNVQERTDGDWMAGEELELSTAGSPVAAIWWPSLTTRHGWSTTHTATPLSGFAETVGRLLIEVPATGTGRRRRPEFREVMFAELFTELPDTSLAEASEAPGAPGAAILLRAIKELTEWLNLTQKQLAGFVEISPSTVMAWKRDLTVHPRHSQISTLLSLWAAVSGAREEVGASETTRLIWTSPSRPLGENPDASAVATALIMVAETASLAAFELDDGYDSTTALPTPIAELEAGERELSAALNQHLGGLGEPATE